MRIQITYYWKLFWIKDRMYERLIRVYLAGVLIKLGYRISPDVEKAIELMVLQKWTEE